MTIAKYWKLRRPLFGKQVPKEDVDSVTSPTVIKQPENRSHLASNWLSFFEKKKGKEEK